MPNNQLDCRDESQQEAYLIQRFVPDCSTEYTNLPVPILFLRDLVIDRCNLRLLFRKLLSRWILFIRQIHLVDQDPYSCITRIVSERAKDILEITQIRLPFC